MAIDIIHLTLLQKQLDHISQQMGWVMMRTARSPIFSVSHDFSCFMGDKLGRIIAQADGIPIHTGGGGHALQAVIRQYGESIAPGDVYILNDPYVAGGNHLPDYTVLRPVFVQEALVGFVCNRGHQSDIGGGAAGTYNPAATEIFHEGLRIPVMRLVTRDVVNEDLWRLLLLNTRCPELMDGDLRAMVGSTKIGASRLAALVLSVGLDKAPTYFDEVLDYAERRMRSAIATLPAGEYHAEDVSDNDCFELRNVPVRLKLTITGDELEFDFTGTAPQIDGFKNSSFQNTCSAVYLAVSTFFDYEIPRNEGTYRPVRVIAPSGTVVNALPPAPMTMCTVFPAHDIINACWRALALADPERGCGSWGKSIGCTSSGSTQHGDTFVLYHWNGSPAAGAVRERDGFNVMGQLTTLGGTMLPNVESWERIYPIHIERMEFRCDGGGAGARRGGAGIEYRAEIKIPAEHSIRAEGARTATGLGVSGGSNGAVGSMKIRQPGHEFEETKPYEVRKLPPIGIEIISPGGGGFGAAWRRKPEDVLRDVEDEIVSIGAAYELYGVAIDPVTMVIDLEPTATRRKAMASGVSPTLYAEQA
jgi:N-methylhydantoinase B